MNAEKKQSEIRGACCYRREIDEEPWNGGMQEKCTVYTGLTGTVKDFIRGKKRQE